MVKQHLVAAYLQFNGRSSYSFFIPNAITLYAIMDCFLHDVFFIVQVAKKGKILKAS